MTNHFQDYENKINHSENVLIIYGEQAQLPAVAVATSLFVWLKSLDKKVYLVSPSAPIVEFCNLVGINKVKNKLPKENLVITLPYDETKIDKVVSDLNEEKTKLSLIIKPQKGQSPVRIEDLKLNYQAADFDLLILIDVRSQKELDKLSKDDKINWHESEKIITLNSYDAHAPVRGVIAEVLSKNIGFCSFWSNLIKDNEVKIDADQATNLLLGLEKELDNFSSPHCTANEFELAAWLMRQGATRYQADKQAVADFKPEHHLPKLIKPNQK